MLGSSKNLRSFLRNQNKEAKTMCNLPIQIHDDTETRIPAKKAKTSKQNDLEISISHLVTLYPTVN
jgi:hypothetical protein